MENSEIMSHLLTIAEKSFSIFVAIFLMFRLEHRLNILCIEVQKLITVCARNGGGSLR